MTEGRFQGLSVPHLILHNMRDVTHFIRSSHFSNKVFFRLTSTFKRTPDVPFFKISFHLVKFGSNCAHSKKEVEGKEELKECLPCIGS